MILLKEACILLSVPRANRICMCEVSRRCRVTWTKHVKISFSGDGGFIFQKSQEERVSQWNITAHLNSFSESYFAGSG